MKDEKRDLIRELLKVINLLEPSVAVLKRYSLQIGSFAYLQSGLTELEELDEDWYTELVNEGIEEYVESIENFYDEHFNEEELKEIIEIYQKPIMQKMFAIIDKSEDASSLALKEFREKITTALTTKIKHKQKGEQWN